VALLSIDADITGKNVLSISTFEHIGTGDYGLSEESDQSILAFQKLFDESKNFLITIPVGYNARVDDLVFSRKEIPKDVVVGHLVREDGALWREEADLVKARRSYGDKHLMERFAGTCIGKWANSVVILERGNIIFQKC